MLRLAAAALLALSLVACRTHEIDDCLPDCDAADREDFAECVAEGDGECAAGNRRCCALAAECLGALDDQMVVTTDDTCIAAEEDVCWPACTADDQAGYDLCLVMGGAACPPGDEVCCALAEDCLGELGDVFVYADGCCSTAEECDDGEVCDFMTGTCRGGAGCGDGEVGEGEACDPGPVPDLHCAYGAMSCLVCSASCEQTEGIPSFCGDDEIDPEFEDCDPPDPMFCTDTCQSMGGGSCSDGAPNGDETDVDCGGSCPPCDLGDGCRLDRDCRPSTTECGTSALCDPELFECIELAGCFDGDACTDDVCQGATGSCAFPPIDADRDGDGPESLGCGGDCDDGDRNASSLVTVDLGCSPGEAGFGVDNDCDGFLDEDC